MSFNTDFKLKLTESLRRNKGLLYDVMLKECKPEYNDLFIQSYWNRSLAFALAENGDTDKIWRNFKESLEKDDFPELIKVYHYFYSVSDKASTLDDDVLNYLKKKCEVLASAFWTDASMERSYQELSDFNCFEDLVIQESLVEKYEQKGHYFNAAGWCDYYLRLLQFFLPEFKLNGNCSDKKTWRFLGDVSNDYQLGFEFNASYYKSEIERYRLFSPECRIVLLSSDFDRSVKEEEYLPTNTHSHIFVLGENFKNPYFPGIVKNIEVLFSGIMLNASSRFYKLVKENDGIHIKHDKDLGEQLKRYAFFDFYIITFFIKPYLEYLSSSIKNMGNQVSEATVIEHVYALENRNQFILEEIARNEALMAQFKNQKIPKKLLEQMEKGLGMLRTEYDENTKEIQKMRK